MGDISEHFSLWEVQRSDYATRHEVSNALPEHYIDNAKQLATQVLEPVREHFAVPFIPSSWYRNEVVNEGIGGSKTSDHRLGLAADIEIPLVYNDILARWIRDHCQFKQLILEFYDGVDPNSGWVHVSYQRRHLKREVLRYFGGDYEQWAG